MRNPENNNMTNLTLNIRKLKDYSFLCPAFNTSCHGNKWTEGFISYTKSDYLSISGENTYKFS